jgi:hypothetical protein
VKRITVWDGTNNNNRIWGYLGTHSFASPNNSFEIYIDKDLTERGWNGTPEIFDISAPSNWKYDVEPVGIGWDIEISDLQIDSGSSLSASDLGYMGGYVGRPEGYGPGGGNHAGASGTLGGTYGGQAGTGGSIFPDQQYGHLFEPDDLGSGGAVYNISGMYGGNGGGSIKILANNVILDGEISSDGGDNKTLYSTGGSGGSIFITVINAFSGSGLISADGGSAHNGGSSDQYSGAGGGRIHLKYASSTFVGGYSAVGGLNTATPANNGENGTVLVENTTSNTLYVQNSQRWLPSRLDDFDTYYTTAPNITVCSSTSSDPECENGTDTTWKLDSLNQYSEYEYNQVNDDGNPGINLTAQSSEFTINDTDSLSKYHGNNIYRITVVDESLSDNKVWGYLGTHSFSSPTNSFEVFKDRELTERGWRGAVTVFDTSTPSNWTYNLIPIGYGWEISAADVVVDNGSVISAYGLGYEGGFRTSHINGYGPGAGVNSGSIGTIGGSHGGLAGETSIKSKDIYDAPIDVYELGSGGANYTDSNRYGGDGGGSIVINADSLVLDGTINADGEDRSNYEAGGAGGSVGLFIQNSFSGSGTVTADGGDSHSGSYSYEYTAGGGGRIYITYGSTSFTGDIGADGGANTGTIANSGEKGTVVTMNTGSGRLSLQHDQTWEAEDNSSFELWFPTVTDVLVCSASSTANECSEGNDITHSLNSVNKSTTTSVGRWIIGVEDFTVDTGSTLDLIGAGYEGGVNGSINGLGLAGGGGNIGNSNGGSGGGHGGTGADGYNSTAGGIYGSATEPVTAGSGGGAGEYYGVNDGGDGGGALKIIAKNTIKVNGTVTADGQSLGSLDRAGAGAGGSIWFVAGTISGNGNLNAKGGNGGLNQDRGGAGGGGRIALLSCTNTWSGTTSAAGGQNPSTRQGANGSIYNGTASNGYVTNLASGLNLYLESDRSTDLTNPINTQGCLVSVALEDDDNSYRIADYELYYDGNLNSSLLSADSNSTSAYFYVNSSLEDLDGYEDSDGGYTLYVKQGVGERVGICPNATSLANTNSGCANLYYLYESDTNVSVENINGSDFWVISNLNENSGGFTEEVNDIPFATSVNIDSGASEINLTANNTTAVICTGVITDLDGYVDIDSVEAKLFRSGIGSGAVDNANNHYTQAGDTQCVPSNGSGFSEDYTCTFLVQFHADATDVGSVNSAENWVCEMTPSDGAGSGISDNDTIEMNSLLATTITDSIDYVWLDLGDDTGTTNQVTETINVGNISLEILISGDDMCIDYPTCSLGVIDVESQEWSLSSFTYTSGNNLSGTPSILSSLGKPTQTPSNANLYVYWGLGVPLSQIPGDYTGVNLFTVSAQ